MNMEDYLLSGQVIINNSLNNADILSSLAKYGYDEQKIKAGKKILEEARELFNKQKVEYSEQYEASSNLLKAHKAAKKVYNKSIKVARVAYAEDVKAWKTLMLGGKRKNGYAGWLVQADAFYNNIVEITSPGKGIFEYGYTVDKLKKEKELVDNVREAILIQRKETGEAQESTEKRDSKLNELDEWLEKFVKITRIALEDSPQLMEVLGIRA